jgi:O-antigen ligase
MGPNHTPAYSATSLIALVIALVALIWFLRMQKHGKIISANTLTLIVGIIIVYGTITPFLGQLTIIDISSVVGRTQGLTGRAEIWAAVIPYVWDKPFLGSGFGAFLTDEMRVTIRAMHPHNGYLDIILNTGFIGLGFFSVFLIKNSRNAQREMTKNFDWGGLWLGFLLITVVNNISEISAVSFQSPNVVALLLLSFASAADIDKRSC